MRVAGCSLLTLAWLVAPSIGRAEASNPATAEALFRAGREALERGDERSACTKFDQSYKLDPAQGTLLNLATCEKNLGRLASAWAHLRELDETLPPHDDRRPLVKERLEAVEKRLPRLTLVLEGAPPGTKVVQDGIEARDTLGIAVPADPGPHHISVTAPGRTPREYVILLDEGDHTRVALAPGSFLGGSPPIRSTGEHPSKARTAGFVSLGVAAGAVLTAAIAGGMLVHARSEIADHCPNPNQCDDTGVRASGTASTLQATAIVTATVGLLAAGSGLLLLELSSPSKRSPSARLVLSPAAASATVRF